MTMSTTTDASPAPARAPIDADESARRLAEGRTAAAATRIEGRGLAALVDVVLVVPHLKGIVLAFGAMCLLGLAGAFLAGGGPLLVVATFLGGMLYWSLAEYLVHRFVLHWEPTSPRLVAIRRRINNHSTHHSAPDRAAVYVNPRLRAGVLLALSLIVVLLAIGVPLPAALAFFAGTCLAYIGTEYLHSALHVLPMKGTAYARWLNRFHSIHHYRDDRYNHAVLNPMWDYVFGSAWTPARARRERERAAR